MCERELIGRTSLAELKYFAELTQDLTRRIRASQTGLIKIRRSPSQMIVPMLVVLLVPSAVAFHVATIQDAARSRHAARSITLTMAADANGDNDDKSAGPLLPPAELERLRSRIQKIQENGITSPSEKLFELATKETPSALMRSFFAGASPEVSQAMRDAITSLLGSLPPLEFDARMTTTGDKLSALMLQLQMTG